MTQPVDRWTQLDHLVYTAPDVDAASQDLAARLGVTPAPGGRHPAWGTHNALLALGPRVYLEIIGPDPSAVPPAGPRPFGIDSLDAPRLATWVARSADLPGLLALATRLGIDLGELSSRTRANPDGSFLRWQMTDLFADREGGVIPYFIDWGDTPHPAPRAPSGVGLAEFVLVHPQPERIMRVLQGLGLDLPVRAGDSPEVRARLRGPRGEIDLGGAPAPERVR